MLSSYWHAREGPTTPPLPERRTRTPSSLCPPPPGPWTVDRGPWTLTPDPCERSVLNRLNESDPKNLINDPSMQLQADSKQGGCC